MGRSVHRRHGRWVHEVRAHLHDVFGSWELVVRVLWGTVKSPCATLVVFYVHALRLYCELTLVRQFVGAVPNMLARPVYRTFHRT